MSLSEPRFSLRRPGLEQPAAVTTAVVRTRDDQFKILFINAGGLQTSTIDYPLLPVARTMR
jgi:hypothetical protein